MKVLTFVGGYTQGSEAGLRIFESDAETGDFRFLDKIPETKNAIFFALNRAGTRLYTGQGDPAYGPDSSNGIVAAYAVSGRRVARLNARPIGVTPPCYVALDPEEGHLAFAEYTHAVAGVFALAPDGSLAGEGPLVRIRHHGAGPNLPRQDRAHAHCAVVSPEGKYLCVVDLGIDRVKVYDYAACRRGEVKGLPAMSFGNAPGAGPRHLLFHPNRKLAFVIHELGNTMTSYRYTGEGFFPVQTVPLLPGGFADATKASAIKLSADGTQIFCSNRGHDSIAAFALDPASGRLSLMAISRLAGAFPRDFTFMPGERFALVGHERSNTLMTYAYDRKTGVFTPSGPAYEMHRPVVIAFGNAL